MKIKVGLLMTSFAFKRTFTPQLTREKWPKDKAISLYRLIDLLVDLDVLKMERNWEKYD